MSEVAFWGAIETGLIFGLVAFGVYLTFRILDFPDLTVDGSFPLGGAVAAIMIVSGYNPWLATLVATLAGVMAGLATAFLNVRLKILHLLASILVMIALYSINLRIMGRPNIALLTEETIITPFNNLLEGWGIPYFYINPIFFTLVIGLTLLALRWFLYSEMGLAMRATGANPRMSRANGIHNSAMILLGLALSNALVAFAGALFAQSQGTADVTMGVGTIVIGLAAVIGGEAIISSRTVFLALVGALVGSIMYRLAISLALNADFMGLQAQDLNLITALLVTLAIVLPGLKTKLRRS